jgi:hypothetical protein
MIDMQRFALISCLLALLGSLEGQRLLVALRFGIIVSDTMSYKNWSLGIIIDSGPKNIQSHKEPSYRIWGFSLACLFEYTLVIHRYVVPRRLPLRKTHKCSECIVFSALKLPKFTSTICVVDLTIHNLKSHGVGSRAFTNLLLYTLTLPTKN